MSYFYCTHFNTQHEMIHPSACWETSTDSVKLSRRTKVSFYIKKGFILTVNQSVISGGFFNIDQIWLWILKPFNWVHIKVCRPITSGAVIWGSGWSFPILPVFKSDHLSDSWGDGTINSIDPNHPSDSRHSNSEQSEESFKSSDS